MRSGSPVLQQGRLSPAEELQNRRKIRLTQVRQQEQLIAKRIRDQVKQERHNELHSVAQKLTKEFDENRSVKYAFSKQKYAAGLSDFGKAHEDALSYFSDQALCMAIWEQQKKIAKKRFSEAINRARFLKTIEEQNQMDMTKRRQLVAKKERVRAKQIALLPKKQDLLETPSEQIMSESTIVTNQSQTVVVERAPVEEKLLQDAKASAVHEEIRNLEAQNDKACKLSEQIERAHVRHLAALRKTKMANEYLKLEADIKQLQRKAALSTKSSISLYQKPYNFAQPSETQMLETLGITHNWFDADKEAQQTEGENTEALSSDFSDNFSTELVKSSSVVDSTSEQTITQTSGPLDPLSLSFENESTSLVDGESEDVACEFLPSPKFVPSEIPSKLKPNLICKTSKTGLHYPQKSIAFDIPADEERVCVSETQTKEHQDALGFVDNFVKHLSSDDLSNGPHSEMLQLEDCLVKEPNIISETAEQSGNHQSFQHYTDDKIGKITESLDKKMSTRVDSTYFDQKTSFMKDPNNQKADWVDSALQAKDFLSEKAVEKALEHPDVKEFQKKILESYTSKSSSENNSLQESPQTFDQPTAFSISNGLSNQSHCAQLSLDEKVTTVDAYSADDSVVVLEDGLEKIASGINKREAELKHQQALLEEYKVRLIQQQKQHAAIARLASACRDKPTIELFGSLGDRIGSGPLQYETDKMPQTGEYGIANDICATGTSNIAKDPQGLASISVPSMFLGSGPNQHFNVSQTSDSISGNSKEPVNSSSEVSDMKVQEINSFSSHKSLSTSVGTPTSPMVLDPSLVQKLSQMLSSSVPASEPKVISSPVSSVEVHNLSSSSGNKSSLTCGSAAIVHEKLPGSCSSSRSKGSFSFVELSPKIETGHENISQEDTKLLQEVYDLENASKDTFVELQPQLSTAEMVGSWADELNPNTTLFTELTPHFSDLEIKEMSTTQSRSTADISEHPLSSLHSDTSLPYLPLAPTEDADSIEIRSEPGEIQVENSVKEATWKTLLAEPLSPHDSDKSDDELSVEFQRDDGDIFEQLENTLSAGILEEPDLTLVSMNSSVLETNLNSEHISFPTKSGWSDSTSFHNNTAIFIEKVPSSYHGGVDTHFGSSPPAQSSDQCLKKLLSYLVELNVEND